jgi:hypothetical protein
MQTYHAVFTIQSILHHFLQGLCIVRTADRISTKPSNHIVALMEQRRCSFCRCALKNFAKSKKVKTPFLVAGIWFLQLVRGKKKRSLCAV